MEHPLIGNLDHLTEEELLTKISELNNKLFIAARSGNANLCNQIRMALENYQSKYQQKLKDTSKQHYFSNNINIK